MKQTRNSSWTSFSLSAGSDKLKLVLLFVTIASAAPRPDSPGAILVSAPANYVIAANTLQMGARVLNTRGALMRGGSIQWQVSDSSRATINGSGLLLGLSPGPVTVTATDGDSGISGATTILVYPGSVTIASGSGSVQAGDALKLSAQAKDAAGKMIAGVPFQWSSDLPGVARIASDGTLTAVAEGKVTVTAWVDLGPAFARFTAFTNVTITRRADYTLKSLLSSAMTVKGAVTAAPVRVAAAGTYVAAISDLSNGGQALLFSQGGRWRALGTAGGVFNGRILTSFDSVAVNGNGDVLALANAQNEWCEQLLILYTAASQWTPAVLDDTTRCSYWSLTPAALDKQLGFVYRYTGSLYFRKADGTVRTILSVGDKPGGVPVNNITNWSTSPSGKVLIETQNATGFGVYYAWNGSTLQKLFSAGEQIVGNATQWGSLPVEVNPDEYIFHVGGANWAAIARLKNGTWSSVATSGQNGLGWIHNPFAAADSYVFFYADTGGNRSLIRSDGSSLTKLGSWQDWRDISQVFATGTDSAVAFGTMGASIPQALRFTGTSSAAILGPGQPVDGDVSLAPVSYGVPKSFDASGAIVRTAGDALLRASASGITTLLKAGDAIPGGSLSGLGAVAANRIGDLAFTAAHGPKQALYALRNGQIQKVADSDEQMPGNATINGFETWPGGRVAINNPGHVAAFVWCSSGNGVFFFSGNASSGTNVMRIGFGGSVSFNNVNAIALDDSDRVAFISDISTGKRGLFLWDKGTIRELLETGQTDPLGRTINDIFTLQAAGTRFYMRTNVNGGGDVLMADGNTVKVLATESFTTSSGTVVSGFLGSDMAVNTRGDIVVPVRTASGEALLVRRAGGADLLVASGSVQGPDSEWFLTIHSAGISEQGDVVYSTQVASAGGSPRLAIYQATPLR